MIRWHITPDGQKRCEATSESRCRFQELGHYYSAEDAEVAFKRSMGGSFGNSGLGLRKPLAKRFMTALNPKNWELNDIPKLEFTGNGDDLQAKLGGVPFCKLNPSDPELKKKQAILTGLHETRSWSDYLSLVTGPDIEDNTDFLNKNQELLESLVRALDDESEKVEARASVTEWMEEAKARKAQNWLPDEITSLEDKRKIIVHNLATYFSVNHTL